MFLFFIFYYSQVFYYSNSKQTKAQRLTNSLDSAFRVLQNCSCICHHELPRSKTLIPCTHEFLTPLAGRIHVSPSWEQLGSRFPSLTVNLFEICNLSHLQTPFSILYHSNTGISTSFSGAIFHMIPKQGSMSYRKSLLQSWKLLQKVITTQMLCLHASFLKIVMDNDSPE